MIKSCCFTGHRKIGIDKYLYIKDLLRENLESLIQQGCHTFFAGGAIGFDTMAALMVLALRDDKYPEIKLNLILPCREQEKRWSKKDKKIYFEIIDRADSVNYVSDIYTSACMYQRNRELVNNSELCIAYLTEDRGGTFYTVNYAEKNGVSFINLAEE